jgi:tetratricopeptide (TPR) repeat protein
MGAMDRRIAGLARNPWVLPVLGAVGLIAAALVVYLPVFEAGWFFMDDKVFVTDNPLIHAADGLRRFWFTREASDYWPVTSSTLWLEWRLWGMDPAGYHATNIVLHIVTVLLLWTVLRQLKMPGAFLAALIFAVHPVVVESVAWVTERKNLIAMLFYLLSIGGFLRTGIVDQTEKPGPWYRLSLGAFALAMLGKGSVVFLPLVLWGIIAWRRRPTREDLWRLAPYGLIAVGLAAIEARFATLTSTADSRSVDLLSRLLRAAGIIWFYVGKAVWPADLCFDYGQWHVNPADPRWWVPLAAAVAVTAGLWRFRRSGSRPALFAWGYFGAALLPVLGFAYIGFMQYSPVSDHFVHLAMIGPAALAGFTMTWAWQKAGPAGRWPVGALAAAAILALGGLGWQQSFIFSDDDLIYQDILRRNPLSWLAHLNHGLILSDAGLNEAAMAEQKEALRINPQSALAHNNLGIALYQLGQPLAAIPEYEESIRLQPDLYQAHNNLAAALAQVGRLPEAIAQFQETLRIEPAFQSARANLEHVEQVQRGLSPN